MSIDLTRLHVGQTFTVGQILSDDPFRATMTFDQTTSLLLQNAAITGQIFRTAQVTLSTASHKPYVVYHLEDALVSSFMFVGEFSVQGVDFSLSAAAATVHHR